MGVLTVEELKEHFTKIGMIRAVHEIDKLNRSKQRKENISKRYFNRRLRFAKKFGVYSISQGSTEVTLYFEGNCKEDENLAHNLAVDFYAGNEDCECECDSDSEIHIRRGWFDDIMHLWINVYKDMKFDIYQSKLKMN